MEGTAEAGFACGGAGVTFSREPSFACASGCGSFAPSSLAPFVSSGRKLVWRGDWRGASGGETPAVAVAFVGADPAFYGREVAALARCALLDVGPRAIDCTATAEIGGRRAPVIVEEDAGVSLEQAVFESAEVPGPGAGESAPLAPGGSPGREAEANKIAFDLLCQLHNLHERGLYHRDIRSANVCVRRFGPDPQDIRAFLIDQELVVREGDGAASGAAPAVAQGLDRRLFEELPLAINTSAPRPSASSLVRDLGYLAALLFEIRSGCDATEAAPEELVAAASPAAAAWPLFSYAPDGSCVARRIDPELDLDPLAERLLLARADDACFFDPALLARAQAEIHHGGYLDARDLQLIQSWGHPALDASVESVAREVIYPAWRAQLAATGREPEYAGFDDQPTLLQESNRSQARDIPAKVHALGYRIVPASSPEAASRVREFSTTELEYLAFLEHRRWMRERLAAGWAWGPERDDEHRTHPDLLPYDQLSEHSRGLDRLAAQNLLGILGSAGLAVCR